jgi:hypothetical protein
MRVGQCITNRKTGLAGVALPFKRQRNNVNRRSRVRTSGPHFLQACRVVRAQLRNAGVHVHGQDEGVAGHGARYNTADTLT